MELKTVFMIKISPLLGLLVLAVLPSLRADTPASASPPADPASFHLYLLIGQSNMAGRGALDATPPADEPRIFALAPDGTWMIARDPLHEKIGRTEPGVGPGLSFARKMLEANPKITIGLIPCAVGGSPLKRWEKGADLYTAALGRALAATKIGTLKGVLWHQGETDAGKADAAASYESRLVKMIASLREDLGRPELPVVVGEIGRFLKPDKQPHADAVRAAIKRVPSIVPHSAFVDSEGLEHKGDSLHFDTASTRELGVRYARAMQLLENP